MVINKEYGLTPYETREILFYKTDNGEVRVEILLYQESPMLLIFIVRSVGLFYLFLCAALWHMNMFNVITLFVL